VTFLPGTPATSALGKVLGLLALLVLVGFVATAWGVWQQTPWWPTTTTGSAIASLVVALAVWNPVRRPARSD
jgi:membrane protein implicated in regulation of membrane protease activity